MRAELCGTDDGWSETADSPAFGSNFTHDILYYVRYNSVIMIHAEQRRPNLFI